MTYAPPMAWYGSDYTPVSYSSSGRTESVKLVDEAERQPDWKARRKWAKGLVAGRFLPPHRGHEYLIDFALAQVKELTIAVQPQEGQSISPSRRARWLSSLYPRCKVIIDEDFGPVDVVFSSEPAHLELAEQLQAVFVLCDPERQVVPISGTHIRANPFEHWHFISLPARPHFVKVVRVVGSEGSGKTTLCRRLAAHFGTLFVPEFAAELAARHGGQLPKDQLAAWANRHLAARAALTKQANRLLFLDTDLLTVALWGERMHGKAPPWIRKHSIAYDETLVLQPILEGLGDTQQWERLQFFEGFRELPGPRLQGDAEAVFAQAREAICQKFNWSLG